MHRVSSRPTVGESAAGLYASVEDVARHAHAVEAATQLGVQTDHIESLEAERLVLNGASLEGSLKGPVC